MKKILVSVVLCLLLLFGMTVVVGAAEYVYYENDFSNLETLADFTQYCGEWSIVDGQLMLTGLGELDMTDHAFLIYTKDEGANNLTDYIVEYDMLNIQSQAGLLFRCDLTQANSRTENCFYGYMTFVSFAGTSPAIGRANGLGDWGGNMYVGEKLFTPGYNLHCKVTVEGTTITYVVTDPNTGGEYLNYSMENNEWAYGSFGFRAVVMNGSLMNLGLLGFDNLKVTAIGEVGDWLAAGKALKDYVPRVASAQVIPDVTPAVEVTVPEVVKVEASKLDTTKTEYVFYENDFSDPNTIADFTQYRGKWSIKDGRLYYSETTSGFKETTNFSFILYSGNHDANLLRNYTLDVDVYNTQTSTGVLTHADLAQATSDNDAAFYGFTGFISNNATLGATGYGTWEGKYGTNYSISEALLTPGSNYHLRMVHADGTFTFTITPIGSDEVIWSDTQIDGDWPTGTFGFRLRVALDEKVSVGNTSFDNLKVTVHGDEAVLLNAGYHPNAEVVGELAAPSVTLKMTLGKTDYTLNGATKTMDVAPIIRNDRTMLPVRYVAEALGAEIAWDGATSTATITK